MFRKSFSSACALLSASTITLSQFANETKSPSSERKAICILYPEDSKARGIAAFSQSSPRDPLKIAISVRGLNHNSKHEVNIHEFGDLSEGSVTLGENFIPQNSEKVAILGNIITDPFGNAYMCFKEESLTLFGQDSVIGRSLAVHKAINSGQKELEEEGTKEKIEVSIVACGVIGLSKEFKTIPPTEC